MNIVKKLSPNHFKNRNGWKPDMIVNHITEGGYDGSINWLCNPRSQASTHFVVAKDGRITQLVELTDGAWGNGTKLSPGEKSYYGNSTLKAVRDRKANANYYTISIEHEGIWAEGKGKLTPAQLQATIELHKYIIAEVKRIYGVDIPIDREHIVGHYQITPITKPLCPGVNFQWDEIIKKLKGEDEPMLVIIPRGVPDLGAAQILATNLKGAVLDWGSVKPGDDVIQVGGPALDKPLKPCKSFRVVSGANRLETAEAVCKFIRSNK